MALAAVLASLDSVDEALKAHYVEHDGKFHLNLDATTIRDHKEVLPLAGANQRNKDELATAKTDLAKARNDLAAALKDKPDQAAIQAERTRLEKERDDAFAERDAATNKLTGVTRDQALTQALADAGISNPAFQRASAALLRDQIKMVDGLPTVDTGMGPRPLADFVKGWAAGDEGKAFVAPATGGGAGGSDGHPPTKKPEEMSAQDRAALLKSNSAEFYRLFPHAKTA